MNIFLFFSLFFQCLLFLLGQVSGNAEQLARNCRDTARLMGDVGVSMEGTKFFFPRRILLPSSSFRNFHYPTIYPSPLPFFPNFPLPPPISLF